MLKRRISDTLKIWKDTPGHKPLVIIGIRQCGKTYISKHFAKEKYKHVVYINFIKHEERKTAFYGSKDVDTIILNISSQMRNAVFVPGETNVQNTTGSYGEGQAAPTQQQQAFDAI